MSSRRVVGAEAVALLATLLRGEDNRWPIFMLGAGASFRSGVPTAIDAVKEIAKTVHSERKLQGQRPPERVRPTEREPWLQNNLVSIEQQRASAKNFRQPVNIYLCRRSFGSVFCSIL